MSSSLRVAIDADGGDFAPRAIVEGAIVSRKTFPDIDLVLVGTEKAERELADQGGTAPGLEFHRVTQVIAMGDNPTDALKTKQDSAIIVCNKMVRHGEVDAAFSVGNTGAMMAAALLNVRRLKGVSRPALPTPIPNLEGGATVVVDAGANTDCKPFQLLQFAVMGTVYARKLLGVKEPRVGLLNIGAESSKGNEFSRECYALLSERLENFNGNVEGNTVFQGGFDVVVCDGFVGNVFLKTAEGALRFMKASIKSEVKRNPLAMLGMLLATPALANLKRKTDYEEYGGMPLLGLSGLCLVGHGRSGPRAVCNAIRVAAECKKTGLNEELELELDRKVGDG